MYDEDDSSQIVRCHIVASMVVFFCEIDKNTTEVTMNSGVSVIIEEGANTFAQKLKKAAFSNLS